MIESRELQKIKLVRADSMTMKLVEHAIKAERYDAIAIMWKEIELLERDIADQRKSRSKNATMTIIALDAKIAELKLLISTIVARE